jgi:hypothetical protein
MQDNPIPDKPVAVTQGFSVYPETLSMLADLQDHYGITNRSRVLQHAVRTVWEQTCGKYAAATGGEE